MVSMQVYETLIEGDWYFLELEKQEVKVLDHKPRTILSKNSLIPFNEMKVIMVNYDAIF